MAKKLTKALIPAERIERSILLIRGHKVLLDRDLAELYGVKPIALRQQVRRNLNRFPDDFMFQLTAEEAEALVSQNVIPSRRSLGGFLPYAFAQEGVAMLSSVLRSERAVLVNIDIMRAFVRNPMPGPRRPVSPRQDWRVSETRQRDPAWSSGTVESLPNRAARLLKHCGVELIVLRSARVSDPVETPDRQVSAAAGSPSVATVARSETGHSGPVRCRPGQGHDQEFCGMLKKLDETLPLAETSSLANADLAGRFYLASRGVPDYLMTLVRGAAAEALQRGNEQIEMDDLARIFERCLAQQRVLAEHRTRSSATWTKRPWTVFKPPIRRGRPVSACRLAPAVLNAGQPRRQTRHHAACQRGTLFTTRYEFP